MNTSNLHHLAEACFNGACNPHGIIRSLGEHIGEIPAGQSRDSLDLKIIIGQLSSLLSESLGPTEESIQRFRDENESA